MMQWLFFNIAVNIEILAMGIYWLTIYDSSIAYDAASLFNDISIHIAPAIFGFTDVVFSATPVRIFHGIYPFIFGVVYSCFTVIYWAAGGIAIDAKTGNTTSYIYPYLNYDEDAALAIMVCVIVCLITSLIHIFIWVVHQLKKYLTKVDRDREQIDELTAGSTSTHSTEDITT